MSERRVELTSAGWLFDPERLFWLTGQINAKRPPEKQIGLELYPVNYFMGAPGPGIISADRIHQWQKEYGEKPGDIPIERIHLPFHWDLPSAFKNFFWNSVVPFAKPYEPGHAKDRVIAAGVSLLTTTVQNQFAQRLASEFDAGYNAHVYIVEKAAKAGELERLTSHARYTWVENDLDYKRSKLGQLKAERDPQRAIKAVEEHGLEGVILGVDHDFLNGFDPVETFEQNLEGLKSHLKSVHIAGSDARSEDLSKDEDFWRVVNYIRDVREFDNVRFCLDLNPFKIRKLSKQRQLEIMTEQIERLEAA